MAIIKRGENVYLVRVYAGRDPITKKRASINETVKGSFEDAERREQVLKGKVGKGQAVKSGRMTVEQLLEYYLVSIRRRRRQNSQRTLEYTFRKYVVPYIGNLQIRKITLNNIQRLLDFLLDPKEETNNDREQ